MKRRRAKASKATLGAYKQSNQPSVLPQEDAISPTAADRLCKLTPRCTSLPPANKSQCDAPTKPPQKTTVKPSPTIADMSKYEHIQFEVRNGIHGVSYHQLRCVK